MLDGVLAPLLVVGLFAVWSLLGFAFLAGVRADTASLRVTLTSPAIGAGLIVLILFTLNRWGLPIGDSGIPVTVALLAAAVSILAVRRPGRPAGLLPVLGVCLVGFLLLAWPAMELGFRWLGNGNDDMATSTLLALRVLEYPFWAPLDPHGILQGFDYSTYIGLLDWLGNRPGTNVLLAWVSSLTGAPTYQMFMPLIVACALGGAAATGALALQISKRTLAAVLAAGLVLASAMATFGIVQELLGQVFGLGVAAALAALLMRPELYSGAGARWRDILPCGVLATTLLASYVEFTPVFLGGLVAYLFFLGLRGGVELRPTLRILAPVFLIAVVILNAYLLREAGYMRLALKLGTGSDEVPNFGFVFTPAGVPDAFGLQPFNGIGLLGPDISIVLGLIVLFVVLWLSAVNARRGGAAGAFVAAEAGLGGLLALRAADFGLFKLIMWAQPFLAAVVAAALVPLFARDRLRVAVLVGVALLVVLGITTQQRYLSGSVNGTDVHNISSATQVPGFEQIVREAGDQAIISATDNIFLMKIQAAAAIGHQLLFLSRGDVFDPGPGGLGHLGTEPAKSAPLVNARSPWHPREFRLNPARREPSAKFLDNVTASELVRSGDCVLAIPSGAQIALNRRVLPEDSSNVIGEPCDAPQNLLAFTNSDLGQHYYAYRERKAVSFYPLQPDFYFPEDTMSAFGQRALFRVLGPVSPARVVVSLTDTLDHNGSNELPHPEVVGSGRAGFDVVGRGSARIFSEPIKPQAIAGSDYLMLDMGRPGALTPVDRSGLAALWGGNVSLDPRYLATYVRDVSLISAQDYHDLEPPAMLARFPADLGNPDLEYSGIYEDGWVGEDARVRLASSGHSDFVMEGRVPPEISDGSRVRLEIDGKPVATEAMRAGDFSISVPGPPSGGVHTAEVHFEKASALPAPDGRPVGAKLTRIGFAPTGSQ